MMMNLKMARVVLIAMLFSFMFIQLASSQDVPSQACINATLALGNVTQCAGTDTNALCGSECLDLFDAVFDNCSGQVSYIEYLASLITFVYYVGSI